MEYKVVYKPYSFASLLGNARGTVEVVCETGEWNIALNKYVKDGWKIKNSGTIEASGYITF